MSLVRQWTTRLTIFSFTPDNCRHPSSMPTRPSPQPAPDIKTALKDTPKNRAAMAPYILPCENEPNKGQAHFLNDGFPWQTGNQKGTRKPRWVLRHSRLYWDPKPTQDRFQPQLQFFWKLASGPPCSSGPPHLLARLRKLLCVCSIKLTCLNLQTISPPGSLWKPSDPPTQTITVACLHLKMIYTYLSSNAYFPYHLLVTLASYHRLIVGKTCPFFFLVRSFFFFRRLIIIIIIVICFSHRHISQLFRLTNCSV